MYLTAYTVQQNIIMDILLHVNPSYAMNISKNIMNQ